MLPAGARCSGQGETGCTGIYSLWKSGASEIGYPLPQSRRCFAASGEGQWVVGGCCLPESIQKFFESMRQKSATRFRSSDGALQHPARDRKFSESVQASSAQTELGKKYTAMHWWIDIFTHLYHSVIVYIYIFPAMLGTLKNANNWFQSRHWLRTSTWTVLVQKRQQWSYVGGTGRDGHYTLCTSVTCQELTVNQCSPSTFNTEWIWENWTCISIREMNRAEWSQLCCCFLLFFTLIIFVVQGNLLLRWKVSL